MQANKKFELRAYATLIVILIVVSIFSLLLKLMWIMFLAAGIIAILGYIVSRITNKQNRRF